MINKNPGSTAVNLAFGRDNYDQFDSQKKKKDRSTQWQTFTCKKAGYSVSQST